MISKFFSYSLGIALFASSGQLFSSQTQPLPGQNPQVASNTTSRPAAPAVATAPTPPRQKSQVVSNATPKPATPAVAPAPKSAASTTVVAGKATGTSGVTCGGSFSVCCTTTSCND